MKNIIKKIKKGIQILFSILLGFLSILGMLIFLYWVIFFNDYGL